MKRYIAPFLTGAKRAAAAAAATDPLITHGEEEMDAAGERSKSRGGKGGAWCENRQTAEQSEGRDGVCRVTATQLIQQTYVSHM